MLDLTFTREKAELLLIALMVAQGLIQCSKDPIRFKNPQVWADGSQKERFYHQIQSLFVLVIKAFLTERSVASYFRNPLPTDFPAGKSPFYTRQ